VPFRRWRHDYASCRRDAFRQMMVVFVSLMPLRHAAGDAAAIFRHDAAAPATSLPSQITTTIPPARHAATMIFFR